jgi:hypothetical protein
MLTNSPVVVSDEVLKCTIRAQNPRVLTEEEIGHMVDEIRDQERKGESRIVYECIREIEISVVDVLCLTDDLQVLVLQENKQNIKNRQRIRNHPHSISEKAVSGEQPIETAIRGLREELSIKNALIIPFEQRTKEVRISDSTGIITRYIVSRFRALIPFSDMKPEYTEERDGRITHLSWRSVF